MRIPVDFSHRIIVENLDDGTRQVFLLPRGSPSPVLIQSKTVEELAELLPMPEDEGSLPATSGDGDGLRPGIVGDRLTPKDAFGASEG